MHKETLVPTTPLALPLSRIQGRQKGRPADASFLLQATLFVRSPIRTRKGKRGKQRGLGDKGAQPPASNKGRQEGRE